MTEAAKLLVGKPLVAEMEMDMQRRVEALRQEGIIPCLVTILVGDNPASATYVRMKGKACERNGVKSRRIHLPQETTTDQLLGVIEDLNQDPSVHGILLQHPVPEQIDERAAFDSIHIDKDVDGVTSFGLGRTAFNLVAHRSCTPEGIVHLLDYYNIPIEGREVVVVGRSAILGKPVSLLLLNRNATVTICHSKTHHLDEVVRRADIVVAAVGKPKFIQGPWVKDGAVIIDAGYNEGNIGDVDYEACLPHVSAITPVPGGVGPVTIATLIEHTVRSAERVHSGAAAVTH